MMGCKSHPPPPEVVLLFILMGVDADRPCGDTAVISDEEDAAGDCNAFCTPDPKAADVEGEAGDDNDDSTLEDRVRLPLRPPALYARPLLLPARPRRPAFRARVTIPQPIKPAATTTPARTPPIVSIVCSSSLLPLLAGGGLPPPILFWSSTTVEAEAVAVADEAPPAVDVGTTLADGDGDNDDATLAAAAETLALAVAIAVAVPVLVSVLLYVEVPVAVAVAVSVGVGAPAEAVLVAVLVSEGAAGEGVVDAVPVPVDVDVDVEVSVAVAVLVAVLLPPPLVLSVTVNFTFVFESVPVFAITTIAHSVTEPVPAGGAVQVVLTDVFVADPSECVTPPLQLVITAMPEVIGEPKEPALAALNEVTLLPANGAKM